MSIINFNSISGINTISVASSITVGNNVAIGTDTVTATTFSGNLSGNATGLSGTPNVTVGTIGATSLNASGIVTATSFSGSGANLTGVVPTAITVANEASDTTCFPLFSTAATGNLGPKTNTGLTFNSATGALAVTGAISASTNAIFGGTTILTPNSRGATVNIGTNASDQSAELLLGHQGDGFSLITGGGSGFGELSIMKATTSIATFNSSGLTVTGTISATTGMAVGGATAGSGGVAFPATQVASADANTLDDYEEGTWTPSVGGTATYTKQAGNYTKIGNVVTVSFDLTVNSIGSGNNHIISGLPFALTSTGTLSSGGGVGYFLNLAATVVSVYLRGDQNDTYLVLSSLTTASAAVANNNIIGSGTRVMASLTYNT